jgi:pSer/pThr/pTyr-binding forkhead associated (FHA) protein
VPDQLLTILKFCLLALIYLFFLRVLRAVWAEITPPKPQSGRGRAATAAATVPAATGGRRRGRGGDAGSHQLVVIEPAALKGRSFPVAGQLTIGRAANCQITVDDTFVSQMHARVYPYDGQTVVEDLGSTNGTYLNRNRLGGAMVMQPGDRLQVGNTVLELA